MPALSINAWTVYNVVFNVIPVFYLCYMCDSIF